MWKAAIMALLATLTALTMTQVRGLVAHILQRDMLQ